MRYYPTSLALRAKLASTRSLLEGPNLWHVLDKLGIYGHGTELLRVDFSPKRNIRPAWGHGRPLHAKLAALIGRNTSEQLALLRSALCFVADYRAWPEKEDPDRPTIPWRDNEFLPSFDAAALYGVLRHLRPERYLEIGSGMSTRIAYQARRNGIFPMDIISIDPEPRLGISQLCNQTHRKRLEDMDSTDFLQLVTPRTVIFFDGSHRSFPGSDVTVFFLNLLPLLPSGCVVQIHDIYLPRDYPHNALNRLWSEQYILAAYLLGGADRMTIILPCANLASNAVGRTYISEALGTENFGGCSFWFRLD